MVEVPVLYITFCRPDYARRSFDAIKKAQPRKLYFYSNKAREDRPDEVRRNEEVRSFVKEIDWECELKTWYRDEYVDIFTSIHGALDWIFNNEEQAIILEEDCVASLAFFNYCESLLPRYKDNSRVRLISGDNITPEYNPQGYDYFFTHMTQIYGWASWRNKWRNLVWSFSDWPQVRQEEFRKYYPHLLERLYFNLMFSKMYRERNDRLSWDFVTLFNMIKNNEVTIIPKYNLVDDIGLVGDNHQVSVKKTVSKQVFYGNSFDVSHYPENIYTMDSYDYHHFKKHIWGSFIRYEVKKYYNHFIKCFHK